MGSFRYDELVIAAGKHLINVDHTAFANTDWFNELFGTGHQIYIDQAWAEMVPGSQYYANYDGNVLLDADIKQERTWNGSSWVYTTVGHSNVIPVEKVVMPLSPLTGTNSQAHMAYDAPISSLDPPNVTPGGRLIDWVNFAEFGADFAPRVFWDNGAGTGPGIEITTVALDNGWRFNPYSGIFLAGSNSSGYFSPPGTLPVWLRAYRYVGTKGVTAAGEIIIDEPDVDTGTTVVDSFAETDAVGALWRYVVMKGGNRRAGTIIATWDNSTNAVEFRETSSMDIGSTLDVTFSITNVSDQIRLQMTVPSDDWAVRAVRQMI